MNSAEGCATYSDPETGQLLLYTNGVDVWNRKHEKMPNGTGLKGHRSSTRSALILPWPGKKDSLLIFTTDNEGYEDLPHDGLNYSILDLSRDHGYGDIVVKNVLLRSQSSEKLTAVKHCDEKGFYVIAHSLIRDTFFVYSVTQEGVHTPQIYLVGQHYVDHAQVANSAGYLKASTSRDKLASVGLDLTLEIFDFDVTTGSITLDTLFPRFKGGYGLSFSPSGRFLYLGFPTSIYQIDLESDYTYSVIFENYDLVEKPYALALAPDSSVYVSMGISQWLGRIERPDSLGDSSKFNPHFMKFDWNTYLSLPNFVDSRHDWSNCAPPIASFASNDTICESECIELFDRSQGASPWVAWRVIKNGQQVADSRDRNIRFCGVTDGSYQIQLVAYNSGGGDTTWRTVFVKPALTHGEEVLLELQHRRAYPGDTITYSLASPALASIPSGVSLTGALKYDTSVMTPVLPAIGKEGRVNFSLNSADTLSFRFVTHIGGPDSSTVMLENVHWQNACPMPVRTIEGSLKLRIQREGDVLVQEGKYSSITPFPNPTTGSLRVMIDLAREGEVELRVVDLAGRVVRRIDQPLVLGKNWLDLEMSFLAAGTYAITLKSATEYVAETFILLN